MKTTAIIVAAGLGKRFGGETEKQFVLLGDMPVLAHTLRCCHEVSRIHEIILVVAKHRVKYCREHIILPHRLSKVVSVIPGGSERQDSVYEGLKRVDEESDIILVHDGVRPFATGDMFERVIEGAEKHGAAIVAVPSTDTMKRVDRNGFVSETLDRSVMYGAQTPQAFRREFIVDAFSKALNDGIQESDEAGLIERAGYPVYIVPGSERNIKITSMADLEFARFIVDNESTET